MSQNIAAPSLSKNRLPSPRSPEVPSLIRSDSSYYSTLRKRRAKSHKHDTLLKWKIPPKNCLIIKKINDETCTYDALDVALYLLSEKKTKIIFQENTYNEIKQICKQKQHKKNKKHKKNEKNKKNKNNNSILEKSLKIMSEEYKQNVKYQDDETIGNNIHLSIVLGGDGTLLYLVSLFRDHRHVPPIVCFQRGSLGFLAPFQMQNYKEILTKILDKKESPAIAIRMRLTARIWKHPDNESHCHPKASLTLKKLGHNSHRSWSKELIDHDIEPAQFSPSLSVEIKEENVQDVQDAENPFEIEKNTDILFTKTQNIFPLHSCNEIICHALNEVLIHRDNSASMMTANLWIDGDKCTTIQADGMIISTPTGSTAYNISAGGSLISPTVQCIALTPICPHTLSFRPVIVSDETIIHIEIPKYARFNAIISFDGRNHINLEKGDVVEIIKCPYPVPTFKSSRFNVEWFQGLVSKFNWNLREMQKPFAENNDDSKANQQDKDK